MKLTDHSSAASAEVKDELCYTSSRLYVFKACMVMFSIIIQAALERLAYCFTDEISELSAK